MTHYWVRVVLPDERFLHVEASHLRDVMSFAESLVAAGFLQADTRIEVIIGDPDGSEPPRTRHPALMM